MLEYTIHRWLIYVVDKRQRRQAKEPKIVRPDMTNTANTAVLRRVY